ncbi:MAG TPA: glycosyltransferase [Chitinophagaceae bacterium]
MVIDSLGKGGKERRMIELVKGLGRSGNNFDISLVVLSEIIEYKQVYELPVKLEIIKRKFKKDPTISFKLKKIISRFNPDIIHSWSTMSSVYLSFSNLFSRIPFINGVLADAPRHLNIFNSQYLRVKLTTPFTDLFISNSKAGIRSYRTPLEKSVCIYNGIDFGRFNNLRPVAEVKAEILGERPENAFVIAMVATFSRRKDYETLINTAVKMCAVNSDLTFLLVGSGPMLEQMKEKVPGNLMMNKQIIFTGKRDDVESVLQIIDLGVLMSVAENHQEGVSNSIIETMASGKPVIASRGGGTDEVIIDNYNGYLIDPNSENQLREKIELLLNDRDRLLELGQNARKYVEENFELDKQTSEYISIYNLLVKQSGESHKRNHV